MRAADEKAGGIAAQPASERLGENNSSEAKSCPQEDGRVRCGQYIGRGLRYVRKAAELNLRFGPGRRVARELKRARDAFDSAVRLSDYAEHER